MPDRIESWSFTAVTTSKIPHTTQMTNAEDAQHGKVINKITLVSTPLNLRMIHRLRNRRPP